MDVNYVVMAAFLTLYNGSLYLLLSRKWGLSQGTSDTLGTCLLPEHPCLVSAKRWVLLCFLASPVHLFLHSRWLNIPLEKKCCISGCDFGAKLVTPMWRTRLTPYKIMVLFALMYTGSGGSWEIHLCEQHFLLKPLRVGLGWVLFYAT